MPKPPRIERRQTHDAAKRYVQPELIPIFDNAAIETAKTLNGLMREEAKANLWLKEVKTSAELEKARKELERIDNAINEAIESFRQIKNAQIRVSERRKN